MILRMTDLEFKTSRYGNHTSVRVRHVPSGLVGEAEGEGYLRIREEAISKLEAQLEQVSRS